LIFLKFLSPSTFSYVRFGSYSFNKLKKNNKTLIDYFPVYFLWHCQTLKNNLFFRNSLFIETTFLKKLLSSKQTGPKKEEEEKDLIPNLYIYICKWWSYIIQQWQIGILSKWRSKENNILQIFKFLSNKK